MTDALDDDDLDDLDGFDGLHAMIGAARASGFDEEPAPRIDALLMAAARQHAPKPRAAWWGRLADWMRPVIAHPALAGAAALVIVGGAAGVMYRRAPHRATGPIEHVQPTVVQRHAATTTTPDEPPPPPPPPPSFGSGAPPAEVMQPELPRPHVEHRAPIVGRTGPVGGRGDTAPGAIDGESGDHGTGRGLLIAEGPTVDVITELEGKRDLDDEQADAPVQDGTFSAQLGGTQGLAQTGPARILDKNTRVTSADAPPPPPTERVEPQGQTNDETVTIDSTGADRRARAARVQAEQLLGQARTAARGKNCGAVKVMAARVKKLDTAYFRDVFSRDADITRCL